MPKIPTALKELNFILSKRDKFYFISITLLSVVTSLLQTLSVAVMLPFIDLIMNQDKIFENRWFNLVYEKLSFSSTSSFIFSFGLSIFILLILSNSLSILLTYGKTKFTNRNKYLISSKLFKKYLKKDYAYFLDKNTNELSKNILTEVGEFANKFLLPLMDMISNTFMIIFITGTLLLVDFKHSIFLIIFSISIIYFFKIIFGKK